MTFFDYLCEKLNDCTMLNTIDEGIKAVRQGKIVIVVDDENRENEGDFICAAEFATTEKSEFYGDIWKRVDLYADVKGDFVKKLKLPQMVTDNTDNHETAFTVSIDYAGTTTGISAEERGMTARHCISEDAKPEDFSQTGTHVSSACKKRMVC